MEPKIKIEHQGRGTYRVKLDCTSYWVYLADTGFSADDVNRAFKLQQPIYYSEWYKIIFKYLKVDIRSYTRQNTFTKENAVKFVEELEALIVIKRLTEAKQS